MNRILQNPLIYNPQANYMMDLFIAYKITENMNKSERNESERNESERNETKDSEQTNYNSPNKYHTIYKSPKRDNICGNCGQQHVWCCCFIN